MKSIQYRTIQYSGLIREHNIVIVVCNLCTGFLLSKGLNLDGSGFHVPPRMLLHQFSITSLLVKNSCVPFCLVCYFLNDLNCRLGKSFLIRGFLGCVFKVTSNRRLANCHWGYILFIPCLMQKSLRFML